MKLTRREALLYGAALPVASTLAPSLVVPAAFSAAHWSLLGVAALLLCLPPVFLFAAAFIACEGRE